MKKYFYSFSIAICLAFVSFVSVSIAQTSIKPQIRDKWAILIGVDKFKDTNMPDFSVAKNNVNDLKAILEDSRFGRFKPDHILTLTDKEANKDNISNAINTWLNNKALPNDLVVVYISSKIAQVNAKGDPFLFAYDTTGSELNTAVDLKNLIYALQQKSKLKYLLCILDTLFETQNKPQSNLESLSDQIKASLWVVDDTYGQLIADAASSPSLFFQYLLEGIKTGGGNLSLSSISQYVESSVVQDSTKKYGKAIHPRFIPYKQNPEINKLAFGANIKTAYASKLAIGHPVDQVAIKRPDLMPSSVNSQKTNQKTITTKSHTDDDDEDDESFGKVDFGDYMAKMKTRIQKCWHPPVSLTSRRLVAVFSILRNGNIVNPTIVEGSGVKDLDQSALTALHEASPLPPLPAHSPKSVDIRYSFDWQMVGNNSN
jgi:TonB family protein